MIELEVRLLDVRPLTPYYRKDVTGALILDVQTQQPQVEGHRRQVTFATLGMKPDVLPFTLFHDEARGFELPIETRGTLRFTIKGRPRRSDDDSSELYADLALIDFIPK